MKIVFIEDLRCIVGQNAKENWEIFIGTNPEYLLFHLTSFSSCYVILETEIEPSIDIIKSVALLCKQHTKYKNVPNIKVDYTKCKNIIKGENIGEIIFKSNKKVNKIIV